MSVPLREQLWRRKPIVLQNTERQGEELKRSLTFQLMMFGVGATVGTGVFFVLGEGVPKAGPAVLISFLVAGIAAGLSALCYAELASAIPVSGSTYSYAYHALGEFVAVIIASCVLLDTGCRQARSRWVGAVTSTNCCTKPSAQQCPKRCRCRRSPCPSKGRTA